MSSRSPVAWRQIRKEVPDATDLIVVDDGSPNTAAIADVATSYGAKLVRHTLNRGPAAARNTGVSATNAEIIAFIDSDVLIETGCLRRLLGNFDDPKTAAAAPRILAGDLGDGRLAITKLVARRWTWAASRHSSSRDHRCRTCRLLRLFAAGAHWVTASTKI